MLRNVKKCVIGMFFPSWFPGRIGRIGPLLFPVVVMLTVVTMSVQAGHLRRCKRRIKEEMHATFKSHPPLRIILQTFHTMHWRCTYSLLHLSNTSIMLFFVKMAKCTDTPWSLTKTKLQFQTIYKLYLQLFITIRSTHTESQHQ